MKLFGKKVRAMYGSGGVNFEGEVFGYMAEPTYLIRHPDGSVHHWAESLVEAAEDGPGCDCHSCRERRPLTLSDIRMVLCPTCGNKRCPKANDHRNQCTGSNDSGQPGSAYP